MGEGNSSWLLDFDIAVPEDLEALFNALLPDVLEMELPDLNPLIGMYEFCGYSPQEIEENLQILVAAMTESPGLAFYIAFEDLSGLTSQYPKGPTTPTGCCTTDMSFLVAAAVFFDNHLTAFRALAEATLDIDMNDPADLELANLLAAVFLYCYCTDLVDQINLWREAHGEEPFVLNGQNSALVQQVFSALTGQPIQQLERNLLSGAWNQLRDGWNSFFSNKNTDGALDTTPKERYNENSDSGPSRAGASGLDIRDPRVLLNPLTYRGYLYDPDIEMYYLQSRWYNSEWGRFLNADSVFDTGTGVLGTNMFAYCDNNPVNRVDPRGRWSINVHTGWNILKGDAYQFIESDSKYKGTYYGTHTWATELGYSSANTRTIRNGNWVVTDLIMRGLQLILTERAMSWHANTNLFKAMVLPDTRDLNAYETLIRLMKKGYFEDAEQLYKGDLLSRLLAEEILVVAMRTLGVATHPAQDKDGHADYYRPQEALWPPHDDQLDGDEFRPLQTEEGTGIRTDHFGDVLKSRDETYNILGRFYFQYKAVINKR